MTRLSDSKTFLDNNLWRLRHLNLYWEYFYKSPNRLFKPQSAIDFHKEFSNNLRNCKWHPHPDYSVFTQYDKEFYLKKRLAFTYKYLSFYALAKTISPKIILEIGTHAGSGADAYLSGSPSSHYIGIDLFPDSIKMSDDSFWKPYDITTKLFKKRGFESYELHRLNLRSIQMLNWKSDFVVVDAAHDFENEYSDLKLALTAEPTYIFIDDCDEGKGAKKAILRFIKYDVKDRIDFIVGFNYIYGGLLIKLQS